MSETLEPTAREEHFLNNIAESASGKSTETLEPTVREEHFYKAMADAAGGEDPSFPEPKVRKEQWYKKIIDSIQSGGGGGSVPEYEGAYTVTPSESAQTLATDGKKCTDDITVNPISSTYIGSGVTQKAEATYTPTTSDQTIAANQYLAGAQTVKGDANLVAGNIKKNTQIFGVTGTYEGSGGGGGLTSKSVVFTPQALIANNPQISLSDIRGDNGLPIFNSSHVCYGILDKQGDYGNELSFFYIIGLAQISDDEYTIMFAPDTDFLIDISITSSRMELTNVYDVMNSEDVRGSINSFTFVVIS